MQFDEVRNYNFNIITKDYAKFPRYLPLPCHMEHGWTALSNTLKSDINTDKPLMLVFNKRRANIWKKESKIPVAIMGAPFIHYKKKYNIKKIPDAQGTIAFPGHSTYFVKNDFNIKNYCKELKKLPEIFQPITICLFWLDYIDPTAEIYRKMGFRIVTTGYKITNSSIFINNLYDQLSSHKYATSNIIGSYTFCAVDMGIPFFLIGRAPTLINKNCRDNNMKKITKLSEYRIGKYAMKLFNTGPVRKISNMQRQFVIDEMGIKDCLSPKEMNILLWKYYNKNHYWLKVFIPYLFASLFAMFVFNGPWIKFLIGIRKNMTK